MNSAKHNDIVAELYVLSLEYAIASNIDPRLMSALLHEVASRLNVTNIMSAPMLPPLHEIEEPD